MFPVVPYHHGIAEDLTELSHNLIFYRDRSDVLPTRGNDKFLNRTRSTNPIVKKKEGGGGTMFHMQGLVFIKDKLKNVLMRSVDNHRTFKICQLCKLTFILPVT